MDASSFYLPQCVDDGSLYYEEGAETTTVVNEVMIKLSELFMRARTYS